MGAPLPFALGRCEREFCEGCARTSHKFWKIWIDPPGNAGFVLIPHQEAGSVGSEWLKAQKS